MSSNEPNVEKEARNHRPALLGIFASVAFAAILLTVFVLWVFADGDAPEGAETQVEPGVGTEPAN